MAAGLIAAAPSRDHRELWKEVWSRVDQAFPMNEAQALMWQGLRNRVDSQLASISRDDRQFLALVNNAFRELGVSHLRINHRYPSTNSPSGDRLGSGYAGFELANVDGAWYVRSVEEGSDFHCAGVAPGWQLNRVDDQDLSGMDPITRQEASDWALHWRRGPVGTKRSYGFLDLAQSPVTVEGTLAPWRGSWSRPFGHLRPLPQRFTVRDEEGIRIITFAYFTPEIMQELLKSIRGARSLRGLILDLRENGGGIAQMATGIAGVLTDVPLELGVMHLKEGKIRFPVYPQASPYLGPLAILIDNGSASTAEILAAGLQEAGRARVFGSRSMGAALPSSMVVIDQRFTLQLPIATFTTGGGHVLEGQGVEVDHEVLPTKQDLIQAHDPVISVAVEWILNSGS